MIRDLLLWEKWRPKSIEDIILPDRIRDLFTDGISGNYIFYGNYGTGKTSLARILIGKYTKDKSYLELNSSFYTSIDTLRNEIDRFCKTTSILEGDGLKYVFLDEFEKVSASYQEAFKAFVEQYHERVRFILTTNHFSKISDGIKSRFKKVSFDPASKEEIESIKLHIFNRLSFICTEESIEIEDTLLSTLIDKKYPDIRSMIVELDSINSEINSNSYSDSSKIELYRFLFKKDVEYEQVYHFVMDNFGPDNIRDMIYLLGRPLVEFLIEKKHKVDRLFDCNEVIAIAGQQLDTSSDPVIVGMTAINGLRKIFLAY